MQTSKRLRILMIATDWNVGQRNGKTGGVTHYRLELPKQYLEAQGHKVDLKGQDFALAVLGDEEVKEPDDIYKGYQKLIKQYDVVISKLIDNRLTAALMVKACKECNVKLIVDVDDNFLKVRPDQPAYQQGYSPGGPGKATALAYLSMADAIFVSTDPLKEELQKVLKAKWGANIPTYVLPNSFDLTEWKPIKKKEKVIGWCGSVTHDKDLKLALPGLVKFLERNKDWTLEFVGGITEEHLHKIHPVPKGINDRIKYEKGTVGYEGFTDIMKSRNWTLGIAPLEDEPFNRSKSHIKWAEYALVGIPCLASPVHPYKEPVADIPTITPGETGYHVKMNNWFNGIVDVLETDHEKVAENARQYVMENFDINKTGALWQDALQAVV